MAFTPSDVDEWERSLEKLIVSPQIARQLRRQGPRACGSSAIRCANYRANYLALLNRLAAADLAASAIKSVCFAACMPCIHTRSSIITRPGKNSDPGFDVLDNSANERPDWYEYWPIRKFLLNETLDENAFYGFLSPKFKLKTNLSAAEVRDFIKDRSPRPMWCCSAPASTTAPFT